ncbi:PQQ-dependent sugar dehydrogenase [Aquabacterium sp.]|uniref:PQQ-dependent sugar dehydrogenase n=1 Tax=Aquabacterium sp. TaxID=1872578 RepID=UPI002BB03713|nr:sorbosone dehydrogenase family protein [Aquabacterium sp.]HSW03188.1 sorbosone dehydrogenase family protein [Aquabacterium sp.]
MPDLSAALYRYTTLVATLGAALLVLTACGEASKLPDGAGTGANPELPAPQQRLLPTVNIAEAKGWPAGRKPAPIPGTQVSAFASGLQHPRWLYVLPNGDVLVAESNAPPKGEKTGGGVRSWITGKMMAKAGAAVSSANRITLLRDADGDGVAESRSVFIANLHSPFGMVLVGNDFYVANADAVLRFAYTEGAASLTETGSKLVDLPGGPLNHHWTKNLVASRDGSKLYATVGSNSNIGENGLDIEAGRAAIWEIERSTGKHRLFATGLRNPNGMVWEPNTGALWTVVNERDELGNDLVPDYLTSVKDGGFYGWPYSYYGQHVDARVEPPRPDLVAKAIKPDYALGSHVAPLGLALAEGKSISGAFLNGMFIGLHGSWNREPRSGYKVVFVPFANGRPNGKPMDVLTGFVDADDDKAMGRPVGVAIDKRGGLLVADDVGNTVWRVSAPP